MNSNQGSAGTGIIIPKIRSAIVRLCAREKTALVDSVYMPFSDEMVRRIRSVVDPSEIDYVVANHVETDHSSSISEILRLTPNAKVIGTARCQVGLEKHYYGNWSFQIVKTGDELSLGDKTLRARPSLKSWLA